MTLDDVAYLHVERIEINDLYWVIEIKVYYLRELKLMTCAMLRDFKISFT
jgi:hypothetical protein